MPRVLVPVWPLWQRLGPTPLPSRLVARLLAGLLVLAAMLQALAPLPSGFGPAPLGPTRGSAFSASTADVALVPPRAAEAARIAPLPLPPLPATPRALPSIAQAAALPTIALRPHSTGPPPREPRTRRPDPRGPPLA